MIQHILVAKELYKTYELSKGNYLDVLKNVSLRIETGEFVSVMGPSGSGKSTLLYLLSGMDHSNSGTIIFNGQDISTLSEKELSALRLNRMGFIFQQIYLLKNLSIFDNILLPAYMARKRTRKEIKRRATVLMKKMGIAQLAGNDITQASGGQLQRVAICRALINNPSIIFGDEPTGALNSKSAEEIMEILTRLNLAGATILLVTHDIKIAARTDRVLYMLDGQIIGEWAQGKYKKGRDDLKARGEKLTEWLLKMDF